MSKNIFINEKRPHDSASKHVSGYADYTDDINETKWNSTWSNWME